MPFSLAFFALPRRTGPQWRSKKNTVVALVCSAPPEAPGRVRRRARGAEQVRDLPSLPQAPTPTRPAPRPTDHARSLPRATPSTFPSTPCPRYPSSAREPQLAAFRSAPLHDSQPLRSVSLLLPGRHPQREKKPPPPVNPFCDLLFASTPSPVTVNLRRPE